MHSGNGGGGWLSKWKKYMGLDADDKITCACCRRKYAEHGGHVIKVGNTDKKWYIVPLCANCNEGKDATGEFLVEEKILAPVAAL